MLINGGVRTTSTYDAANELTRSQATAGTTTYTFDATGNLLSSRNPSNQRTTNTWDFENRLTQVALPSGSPNTFTYNGDGQRVQKQDSTGTTKHVWDGQNILLETDGSNIIQVVYTLQPEVYGNLISQRRSGTTSFYLFDGLGSTRQLVGSTGSVTDSYLYDSFGNALLTSGTTVNPFQYVGQVGYYRGPDLVQCYLRARYYDPTSGRFISQDPLAERGHLTTYGYCGNDPASLIDPSGLLAGAGFCVDKPWPCIYGNWCGARCPLPTENPPAIDCLDASCADHDICYRNSFYFNKNCDVRLCFNIAWCLSQGNCTSTACRTVAIGIFAGVCPSLYWRLPTNLWPFKPFPPKTDWPE